MNVSRLMYNTCFVLAMTGAMSLMAITVHAEHSGANNCCCQSATTRATAEEAKHLPRHGRVRSDTAPPKALFGMIWNDTKTQREYIFDGNEWVPHDNTVEDYYAVKRGKRSGARGNGGGK